MREALAGTADGRQWTQRELKAWADEAERCSGVLDFMGTALRDGSKPRAKELLALLEQRWGQALTALGDGQQEALISEKEE